MALTQREFQDRLHATLAEVANEGEIKDVLRYTTPYVTLMPANLSKALIEAAGERGQQIIAQYRRDAARRGNRQRKVAA